VRGKITAVKFGATECFDELEGHARGTIQHWMQRLLEEEVKSFLGWVESRRTAVVDRGTGCRNGFGKVRRFSMSSGIIEVRRPQMRGLGSDSSAEYCRCPAVFADLGHVGLSRPVEREQTSLRKGEQDTRSSLDSPSQAA
jgi:hypothetical protein